MSIKKAIEKYGISSKFIAESLNLSIGTVKNLRSEKLENYNFTDQHNIDFIKYFKKEVKKL